MKYQHPRYLFRRYEILRRVKSAEHFLEIGPGNLDLAQELLTKFHRGTLIDFNITDIQQIYEVLEESKKRRLELIIADFNEYDSVDKHYDCIVSCDVLEHVKDDVLFLRKFNQLLIDGGQLILSVPAKQKYWSRDDEIVGHYRRYEKKELEEKLLESGFSRIVIISYGFPFQNLVRLGRIGLAKKQYSEKAGWDKKRQSQQSAFLLKRKSYINPIGLILNKYTLYPFNLISSLFNRMDLGEGYVACAVKSIG